MFNWIFTTIIVPIKKIIVGTAVILGLVSTPQSVPMIAQGPIQNNIEQATSSINIPTSTITVHELTKQNKETVLPKINKTVDFISPPSQQPEQTTFVLSTGAIVDQNGKILNQEEMDRKSAAIEVQQNIEMEALRREREIAAYELAKQKQNEMKDYLAPDERTILEKQRTTIEKDLRITASCSGSVISCTVSVRYLENNQGINGIPITLTNTKETKISSIDGTAQFVVSMKKYGNVTKGVRINAESNGVTKTLTLE